VEASLRADVRVVGELLYAVVSRLVDREVRASDTAITVAGDTTPGTRFAAAEPRDAAGRPYPSVRMVLARRLSVAGHGLSRLVESRLKGT